MPYQKNFSHTSDKHTFNRRLYFAETRSFGKMRKNCLNSGSFVQSKTNGFLYNQIPTFVLLDQGMFKGHSGRIKASENHLCMK